MNEYARLSELLAAGFAEMERRVGRPSRATAQTALIEAVSRQIVDELAENVARLTRSGSVGLFESARTRAAAPGLKPRIEALAVDVEYAEDGGVEITVAAQATEIRSELAAVVQSHR